MENNRKYFAFISYKREDEKWAKWLQHKLEHYQLPSNLNGRTDWPKEIRPIFRDQSELAGGVLADEINKALANSKYLIVICSPRAAQSVWVGKEVQTFIDLGRTDKIIPFIIGGMAHAQNPEEECFPLALLNLPPDQELLGINIDEMRRDAAAVKVVAQMLGLKFDALWQRYEREQRRRRVIFIAAALLLALIGVGVAVGFSRKNKRITEQNEQITKQNEEIVKQSEDIKRKNDRLMNDSVVMAAQLDSINRRDALIEIQKDSILHANYQILLTNNQIWAKNKKLRNQKLVQDIEISKNYLSQGKPEMAIVALEDVRKNVVLLDSLQKDNYGRLLLSINDSIMVRQVELLSISDYGNKKHKIIDSDSCIKKSPVVESYFREDRGGFEDKGDILWGEASLIISPENHFAGTILANSISFEGNSEAHFYSLQIDNLPYISSLDYHNVDYKLDESRGTISYSEGLNPQELQEGMVVKFKVNAKLGYQVSNIIIKDEEGNIIEYRKVSDDEYEFTMPATNVMTNPTFEKKEVIDLITNPETGLKISVFLIAIISLGTGIYVYQKKESKKI